LLASKILGPRKDRFNEDLGNPLHVPNPIQGYSVSLQVLGTLLLWFGWYGFNAGGLHFVSTSEYANVAALATLATTLSASCGTISSLAVSAYRSHRLSGEVKFDVSYALNGCLSGLVAITGSCGIIEPWAALIIGMISGLLYNVASLFMVYLRIDDAVDAIPVHLFNGIWGVIAAGLFASPERLEVVFGRSDHVGWFYSWGRGSSDATLLATNIVGLLFIFGFVSVVMIPFFSILMYLGWLRSDPLEEILGLDCRYRHGVTHKEEPSGEEEDDVCTHSTDPMRNRTSIDYGKTSGKFLCPANSARRNIRRERLVSLENLAKICECNDDLEVCDSNQTIPSSTVVSDPAATSSSFCQRDDLSGIAENGATHDARSFP
jgi:ammonia channel protein AmtB